jgi:GTP cyclohydrolase I
MDAVRSLVRSAPRARIDERDRVRFERHLAEILAALGLDLSREGTRTTPSRLLQAWIDATSCYDPDPKLVTTFPAGDPVPEGDAHAQVVEGPIAFTSLCEHHALPFFGAAWVGYVARDRLIGLSKLTRLVRRHARRFTMQERLCTDVAAELARLLDARGTAVRIEAAHLCTRMRGVCEAESMTATSAWRGVYGESGALRGEFLSLCVRR